MKATCHEAQKIGGVRTHSLLLCCCDFQTTRERVRKVAKAIWHQYSILQALPLSIISQPALVYRLSIPQKELIDKNLEKPRHQFVCQVLDETSLSSGLTLSQKQNRVHEILIFARKAVLACFQRKGRGSLATQYTGNRNSTERKGM
jgi:hypothetical protein